MRGTIYSEQDKGNVKRMILEGKSYKEITDSLGVPKSTISTWFGNTLKRPRTRSEMLNHLKIIRKLAVVKIKNKWKRINQLEDELISRKITEETLSYPLNNPGFYKSMLAMLYWAEGSKYKGVYGLGFVNTDPILMRFYLTLLRKCYVLDERRLKVRVHVHYYHSIKKVKVFWSKLLNIPIDQFGKIYIKKRSKTKRFRKNFMGICFINYYDSKIRKELMEIVKKLSVSI